jgi:hypothetical protein
MRAKGGVANEMCRRANLNAKFDNGRCHVRTRNAFGKVGRSKRKKKRGGSRRIAPARFLFFSVQTVTPFDTPASS